MRIKNLYIQKIFCFVFIFAALLPLAASLNFPVCKAGADDIGEVKFREFLLQKDNGITNAEILNVDADKKETWAPYAMFDENGRLTDICFADGKTVHGALDLSGCSYLLNFICGSGQEITSINLSGCAVLMQIFCSQNPKLTEINLSRCGELRSVNCVENSSLKLIDCGGSNNITDVTVCDNPFLESFICDFGPELILLNISDTRLGLPGLSKCVSLEMLYCEGLGLTSLDVSDFKELKYLACSNNLITELNISELRKLNFLKCSDNQIAALDLSSSFNLELLDCGNMKLTALDVSGLAVLEQVKCVNNQIISLDVSGCKNLSSIIGHGNPFGAELTERLKESELQYLSFTAPEDGHTYCIIYIKGYKIRKPYEQKLTVKCIGNGYVFGFPTDGTEQGSGLLLEINPDQGSSFLKWDAFEQEYSPKKEEGMTDSEYYLDMPDSELKELVITAYFSILEDFDITEISTDSLDLPAFTQSPKNNSLYIWLGITGFILLLAAGGAGFYIFQKRKKEKEFLNLISYKDIL